MITYRRLWARKAKLGFFTWNNLAILGGRKAWLKRHLWRRVCRGTDFAIAGNATGSGLITGAGYPGRMVTQPELGVDPDCFFPDEPRREAKRRELGLADRFTIGFVGRLTESKGLKIQYQY